MLSGTAAGHEASTKREERLRFALQNSGFGNSTAVSVVTLRDARSRPPASVPFDERHAQVVDWTTLPKCSIAGFTLRECGLYDLEAREPLTANDMRMLINELSKLEGSAMYAAESRLYGSGVNRLNDASMLISPFISLVGAFYFLFVKLVSAYDSAYPQHSVIVRRWARHRMDTRELERFCMTYRALLNFTNLRTLFFFGVGCTFVWGAKVLWPAKHMVSPYDHTSRETTSYFRHVEAALKWAYAVYASHPAYRDAHRRVRAEEGLGHAEAHSFPEPPTFKGKRHLLTEVERMNVK
jgi:hypothetical protein